MKQQKLIMGTLVNLASLFLLLLLVTDYLSPSTAFSLFPTSTRRNQENQNGAPLFSQKVSSANQKQLQEKQQPQTKEEEDERFQGFGGSFTKPRQRRWQEQEDQHNPISIATKNVDPHLTVEKAKQELITLLTQMTGNADDFRRVEILVNTLEAKHQPIQTFEFLNLMQQGRWQLLFSTNLLSSKKLPVSPQVFRLRALQQHIHCRQWRGNLTTTAVWDWAEHISGTFDCTGEFIIKTSYEIEQGSRLQLRLQEHILKNKGKLLPSDVQALVGLLFRAIPRQVCDPTDHAADTTYLDGSLKILRFTGPSSLEAVRDIWIRQDDDVDAIGLL